MTVPRPQNIEASLTRIRRNTDTIIGLKDLEEHLRKGRSLNVKLGVDPTRPDLTFGHLVVFDKLREFQYLGHTAVLIIGDFTARIGDPSGRSSERPPLTAEQVRDNAQTYLDQAFKVLDRQRTTVHYNSEWFGTLSFEKCLDLARKMTVARMLERDDFAQRYAAKRPISLVEFLYPLIQAHDSMEVQADVEIGGTDQIFNMLVGRKLQEGAGKPPQVVITMPLLVGLDGVKKMSKSLDNYISFTDSPKDMFGKIMSLNDDAMWDYYRLLCRADEDALTALRAGHPMDAKRHLACSLVARFYSEEEAERQSEQFSKIFSHRRSPDEMPTFTWESLMPRGPQSSLVNLIAGTDLFATKSDVRRLIQQGAVKVDGVRQTQPHFQIEAPRHVVTIQVGKRTFFRITP